MFLYCNKIDTYVLPNYFDNMHTLALKLLHHIVSAESVEWILSNIGFFQTKFQK